MIGGVIAFIILFLIVFKIFKREFFAFIMTKIVTKMNKLLFKDKIHLFKEIDNRASKVGKHQYKILEIGGGSGANFQFIKTPVDWTVSEPNVKFAPYFKETVEKEGGEHKITGIIEAWGQDLSPFETDSFDAVIITLVLCSIDEIDLTLKEIHRVLKPGGSFFFVEHVGAESGTWTRTIQNKISAFIWPFFCDGCVLNKDTEELIRASKFSSYKITPKIVEKGYLIRNSIYGYATK